MQPVFFCLLLSQSNWFAAWKMEENGYPVLKNQPRVTVKETIELKVGQRYLAKPGIYYRTTNKAVARTDVYGRIIAESVGTAIVTIDYSHNYAREITVIVKDYTSNKQCNIIDILTNSCFVRIIDHFISVILDLFFA